LLFMSKYLSAATILPLGGKVSLELGEWWEKKTMAPPTLLLNWVPVVSSWVDSGVRMT
jgi:hypothetical protein